MRPAFLAAAARPFLRSPSTAFSVVAVSLTNTALQSIIGAPVRSRSCLTICAVTSMSRSLLDCRGRPPDHALAVTTEEKRKGQIDAGSTDLFATRPAARRRPAPDMVACRRLRRGRAAHSTGATRAARPARCRSGRRAARCRVLVERRRAAGRAAAGAAVLLLRHHLLGEPPGALDVGVGNPRREQPD